MSFPDGQVEAAALPPDRPRVVWDAPQMRRLRLMVPIGPCENAHADILEQSTTSVRIDLVVVAPQRLCMPPCMPEPSTTLVEAWLDQSLGGRTLILTTHRA